MSSRSADALRLLERFLSELPPALRVALATRQDPGLGLHRLRLTDRLTEVRADDLRFSLDETRRLLEADGITLADEAVALLHERTEGWVAGLRLAALTLAKHPDPERFVSEFTGSERTVAATSWPRCSSAGPRRCASCCCARRILEQVSGPLADFLTGGSGSERILQQLEDANAFVVSLDAGSRGSATTTSSPSCCASSCGGRPRRSSPRCTGRRRAGTRSTARPSRRSAMRRPRGDWPHAARLLADGDISLVFDGRTATLRALLAAFPAGAPDIDAELALVFAKGRLFEGALDDSATYIAAARRLADTVPAERRWRFDLQLLEADAGARASPRERRHRGGGDAGDGGAFAAQPPASWR